MLKINNLTKRFGNFGAVNQLSLEVSQPGLYLFVGDNGSGKTTLFNLVAGLINPDDGEISLNNITDADLRRKQLGISTEPFTTEPSLTILEIAEIIRQIKHVSSAEMKQLFKQWEIWSAREKPFKALSTGMKKRLSLALSMIGNPEYLLWDEPFNGLDPLGIKLLNEIILNLTRQGKTIFLSTHLLNELNVHANTCFVMKNGNLIGTVHNEPATDFNKSILNLLKTRT
ncbi:ABC transporter ATP-binding protein [uncultured Draconibacterium sp.]|uniref:ABC transporter ATP-binding protein n=1 Tax=uncultured Draconibacterium sp. TaxID=1573823 RepID=UPI002AA80675|nr:ABC transporter ATP-binding protein [uncultured Draconibacterium sp.]